MASIANIHTIQRIAVVKDVKANNTDGGSSVATTWTARDLNTLDDPTGVVSSLSANTITLSAGTYFIRAVSPYEKPADCKTRIYNTTTSSTLLVSDNTYGATATDSIWKSHIAGHIVLTAPSAIQLQYWVLSAYATIGLGEKVTGANNTEPEVYSIVEVIKIK